VRINRLAAYLAHGASVYFRDDSPMEVMLLSLEIYRLLYELLQLFGAGPISNDFFQVSFFLGQKTGTQLSV